MFPFVLSWLSCQEYIFCHIFLRKPVWTTTFSFQGASDTCCICQEKLALHELNDQVEKISPLFKFKRDAVWFENFSIKMNYQLAIYFKDPLPLLKKILEFQNFHRSSFQKHLISSQEGVSVHPVVHKYLYFELKQICFEE